MSSPGSSVSSSEFSASDALSSTLEVFPVDEKLSESPSLPSGYSSDSSAFENGYEKSSTSTIEPNLNQSFNEFYHENNDHLAQNYHTCDSYIGSMEDFHCQYCFQKIYCLANMIADGTVHDLSLTGNYSESKHTTLNQTVSERTVNGPGLVSATRGRSSCFHITSSCHSSRPDISIVDPSGLEIKHKLKKISKNSYIVQYKPDFEGIYSAAISIDNRPIRRSPFQINVTSHHKYQTFDVPKQIIYGDGACSFDDPWGICCNSQGYIIVGDRSQHSVRVFKPSFEYVRSIGRKGSEIGELCKPAGVCTNSLDDIVVADKDNHRIQVFTLKGSVKLAFGDDENSHWKLKYPWDVSAGSEDEIFVSDSRNGRVSCFSAEGDFLKFFDLDTNTFRSPRGVCFREFDSRLFVADFNRHQIVVLKISDNNSIASNNESSADDLHPSLIGNKGRGLSELNRPQGVACDLEGNILVADSRNSRVQVFDPEGNRVIVY